MARTRIAVWLDISGSPDADAIEALAEKLKDHIWNSCYDGEEYHCDVDEFDGMAGLLDVTYDSNEWVAGKPPCNLTAEGCGSTTPPTPAAKCLCEKEDDGAIQWPPNPNCPIHKELLDT